MNAEGEVIGKEKVGFRYASSSVPGQHIFTFVPSRNLLAGSLSAGTKLWHKARARARGRAGAV